MSIRDILIRSISGYIFIVPGIFLYFWSLKKLGKKQTGLHMAAVFVFCYYLIGCLTMTGIGKLKPFSPRMVWIPFLDMISGPVDTVLNVILFLPFGFFLPLLYKKFNGIGRVAFTGFLFSLLIESLQMFGRGSSDINDLITNTAGAALGYLIFRFVSKLVGEGLTGRFRARNIHDGMNAALFVAYTVAVMITVQPWVISELFGLG